MLSVDVPGHERLKASNCANPVKCLGPGVEDFRARRFICQKSVAKQVTWVYVARHHTRKAGLVYAKPSGRVVFARFR